MRITTNLRNWGEGSDPATLLACARAAEEFQMDTLWVNERMCTPPGMGWRPEDGGRYLDLFLTLATVAGATKRLRLGTATVNVPFRRPLQFVRQVISLQDLSQGRLRLGVGAGWYEKEFRALGVDPRQRGKLTDSSLEKLERVLSEAEAEFHGVDFPVLPRVTPPELYVGGKSEAALRRVLRFGAGYLPAGQAPEELAIWTEKLKAMAEEAQKPMPVVVAMKTLPIEDEDMALKMIEAFSKAGADEVVHAGGYKTLDGFQRRLERLAQLKQKFN